MQTESSVKKDGKPVTPFGVLYAEGTFMGLLYASNPDENLEETFREAERAWRYADGTPDYADYVEQYMNDRGYGVSFCRGIGRITTGY